MLKYRLFLSMWLFLIGGESYAGQITSVITGVGNSSNYVERSHFTYGSNNVYVRLNVESFATSKRCYYRTYVAGNTPGSYKLFNTIPANGIVESAITVATSGTPNRAYIIDLACGGTSSSNPAPEPDGDTTSTQIFLSPAVNLISFTTDKTAVAIGESYSLNWQVQNAVSCTLDGETLGQESLASGNKNIAAQNAGDQIHTLRCMGAAGAVEGVGGEYDVKNLSKTVNVAGPPDEGQPPVIDSFILSPASIFEEDSSALTWSVQHADSCVASGAWFGDKSVDGDTEVMTGLAMGEYVYTLTCENTTGSVSRDAVLRVIAPVSITSFSVAPTSILTGEVASLNWAVENADSCTASDSWTGNRNALSGSQNISNTQRNTPGTYTYVLTCQKGISFDSKSVTLDVVAGEPEILSFQIDHYLFNPHYKDEDGVVVIAAGANLRFVAQTKNISGGTTACLLNGSVFSTGQRQFNEIGDTSATLVCNGFDGKGTVEAEVPIRVVPPTTITSFTADPSIIGVDQSSLLIWTSSHAETCTLNNEPVPVTGSHPLSALLIGNHFFELKCVGKNGVTEVSSNLTVTVSELAYKPLSGKYFGPMDFNMAVLPGQGFPSVHKRPLLTGGGTYDVPGFGLPGAYWLWDFDALEQTGTGTIQLGGANIRALQSLTPLFRLFSPGRTRLEGQYEPEINPPLVDHLGSFTSNGDGTYSVRFNFQIFLSLAGYPMAPLLNQFQILENGDGTLKISIMDHHPDYPYGEPDGIPGVPTLKPGDIDEHGNVIVEAFPARVAPQFYGPRMVKLDYSQDCNGNGIPNAVYEVLRLDPCLVDNDGDGISDVEEIGDNWVLPVMSDLSAVSPGIADVYSPSEFLGKPNFFGAFPLGNGERIVIYSEEGHGMFRSMSASWEPVPEEWFGRPNPYFLATPVNGLLPTQHPVSGEALRWDLGSVIFRPDDTVRGSYATRIYFNKGVPQGLLMIDIGSYYNRPSDYTLVFRQLDTHTVEVKFLREPSGDNSFPFQVAFAYTGESRVFANGNKFNKDESGFQAILQKARDWDNTTPTEPEPTPILINNFVPSATNIVLGSSVQLLWQAENAGSCSLSQGASFLSLILPVAGSYEFTPDHIGSYNFELVCVSGTNSVSATTTVYVQEAGTPLDPNAITGVWSGHYNLTMRTAPEGVVLGFSTTAPNWTWNFDEGWAQFGDYDPALPGQGVLSVGFPFHVQDIGNVDPVGDRAFFTNNGDGTYTLHHGYQIYNPYVGNPRTEVATVFRITRNGNQLDIVTVDSDNDGVPGVQVPGVFPLTVSPDFVGSASQNGGGQGSSSSSVSSSVSSSSNSSEQSSSVASSSVASNVSSSVQSSASAVSSSVSSVASSSGSQGGQVGGNSSSVVSSSVASSTQSSSSSSVTSSSQSSSSVVSSSLASSSVSSAASSSSSSANSSVAITGVWTGHYSLTMRTAPEGVVLGFSTTAPNWTWNFDEGWAQFGDYDPALPGQGVLSVGFPFHVQDIGNVDPVGDRAFFTNNGDGTYTLHHGYQIYNPFVGNPRTEVATVFRITRNGNQLDIVTVDSDNDGVPGVQVPGVFPLTVSPDFVGSASQNGGGQGSSSSSVSSSVSSSAPSSSSSAQSSVVVPGSSSMSSSSTPGSVSSSSSTVNSSVANSSTQSSLIVQSSSVASSSSSTTSSTVSSSLASSSAANSNSSSSANGAVITGVFKGNFGLTMRAFIAQGQGTVLGTSTTEPEWTWNFDEGWAEFGQGMLSVGFPFHVQDVGNASSSHDRAYFTNNGNGTYTLTHGFQIYNPNVGNPRTETATSFRITRNGNQLSIVTLDADNDGIPGTQIIGVFPLTVEPDFIGSATLVQGNNSSSSSQQSSQSNSSQPATAAIVRGRVAVGAPVVNASVVARCSDGSGFTFPVTTDSSGSYAGLIANTASLPCALQASGGQPAVVLHSYAAAPGTVNITPLTDLILASASGQLPSEWFASSNWQSVGSLLATAQHELAQQLAQGNYTLDTTSFAPFTSGFAIGDAHDQLLDQLQDSIAADSSVAGYGGLLAKVKAGGSLAVIPVATGSSSSSAGQSSVSSSSSSSVVSSSASNSSAGSGAITGVWQGKFNLTMRAAPAGIVLGDSLGIEWTWNFDEGWAEFGQGTLSVGFPFHVQDIGNASDNHDRAYFLDNSDGTYTLYHGFQIYNPHVGNPRTETTTTFRITRNGDQLEITTLDMETNGEPDGVPGTQIVGVFPLTVEPDFIGTVTPVGSSSSVGQSSSSSSLQSSSVSSSTDAEQSSSVSSSSSSVGQSSSSSTAPVDPTGPGTAGLTGVYAGEHMITMRGCPGVCVAGQEVVLGTGVKNSPWVWNFDNKTVVITGTTLTVGFNYEVQAIGNLGEGDERLIADFTDNGDGTYTLYHGFQIYNPNVGNPRTDTTTRFRITQDANNPNLLQIITLDGEADGIPGTQVIGVFPMTIQPEFRGSARREGSSSAGDGIADSVKEALGLNPDAAGGDSDGDGIPDVTEIGPDPANPLDSDGDGIIDALEPGNAAWDASRIGGVALLGGIPGRAQEGFPNAGSSINAGVQGDWLFIGADTGLLQLTTTGDNAGAIPDTSLGDAGLDYRYGFVQLHLRALQLQPASRSSSAVVSKMSFTAAAPLAEPIASPVTLTLAYDATLPAADKLLVYATALVDGKERYTLMDKADYRRLNDHTLEVTVKDNGPRDLDRANGVLRVGVAPTTNTLGGHDQSSGNASNGKKSGGGSIGLLMLLALGLLVITHRPTAYRPATYRKAA